MKKGDPPSKLKKLNLTDSVWVLWKKGKIIKKIKKN